MWRSITLALSLLGLFDSLYLLYTYTSPSRPMVCIGTGCDAVRASAYSSVAGVPVPVFGVAGYVLIAIIIIAESLFDQRVRRLARYAFVGITGFGFLVSVYLEYLQAFVIHAYCAWCVTSGVVMTVLFVLGILSMVRGGPEPQPTAQLARVRNLFAVVVLALLVGTPAFYALMQTGEAPPPAPEAKAADLARLIVPGAHEAGNPRAPLTVVEFGDFECPVCGRGEAAAREIRQKYANQVRFVFRQFPLERIHPFARQAAEASECAGAQGRFWDMVEKIYSRQDDLTIRGLERDAGELGMDQARFNQCLTTGAMAARVERDLEDGKALGIRGTPTYFVGRQRIEGVLSEAQFSQLIEAQLAREAPAATPRAPASAQPVTAAASVATPQGSPKVRVAGAPAPPAPKTSAVDPAAPPLGFPTAGIGLGGAQGAAPAGILGLIPSGASCNEADAAKRQPTLIGTQELRHLLSGNSRIQFVDVRPAAEYAKGGIPGAVNIPADEFGQRWITLPKDRTIVLYEGGGAPGDVCAAGRSAGRTLLEHGFPLAQVKVYQDGLAGWRRAGITIDR